jgi:hypothetical protein
MKKNKKLKTCSFCKIAQYCGVECQRRDWCDNHKVLCIEAFKDQHDLGEKAKKILSEKGHDVDRSSLQEFFNDNDDVFQCIKKSNYQYIVDEENCNLQIIDMGQVFWTYVNCKYYSSAKGIGIIVRQGESYHGLQMALEAYLEAIMALQPNKMYLRALVPLLLIQLGRDDEAYNFIKFWLKNTPKEQDYITGEDGLFPNLPFKEHTMKDQDKHEDIFEVLDIKMDEKPYFIYITFYVCLAIIKKKIYDTTKDEPQKSHFVKYLRYTKKHFGDYMKRGLGFPPHYPLSIPAIYGLKEGLQSNQVGVEIFGGDFISNFIDDLNFHLARAPGLRQALINYL